MYQYQLKRIHNNDDWNGTMAHYLDTPSEEVIIERDLDPDEDQFFPSSYGSRSHAKKIRSMEQQSEQVRETPQKVAADLVKAIRSGSMEEIRSVIERSTNNGMQVKDFINETICGSTPLMYACFSASKPEILEYLLDNGADIEAKNLNGINALIWAVERMNYRAVELLLRRGASPSSASFAFYTGGSYSSLSGNGQDSNNNNNSNMFASSGSSSSGLTALHKACRQGNLGMVQVLVELGKVDVNIPTSKELDSCTPLHEAAFYGHADIVSYLLDQDSIDIDKRNAQGRTALHRAVCKNRENIAQLLIRSGADLNLLDNNRRTALHWASFFGYVNLAKFLVDNGAILEVRDKVNYTAEDIARIKKHAEMLSYLQETKEKRILEFYSGSDEEVSSSSSPLSLSLTSSRSEEEDSN